MMLKQSLVRPALATAFVFAAIGAAAQKAPDRSFPTQPTSQEYKIVIKPEMFADPAKAFEHYWDVTKKVAKDNGLNIEEKKQPMRQKAAILQYLDDAKFSLDRKGYILRIVQAVNDGKPADDVAITLKYRSTNPATVKPDTIELATLRKAETEYQDDVMGFIGGQVGKNSVEHSPAAKFKGVPYDPDRLTIGHYAALFPTLNKIGVGSMTKLAPVSGNLNSVVVSPGSIMLKSDTGKDIAAEVDISYWSILKGGKGVVGEISYSLELEDAGPQAMAANQKYFNALQAALAKELMSGATKVEVIYKLAGKK